MLTFLYEVEWNVHVKFRLGLETARTAALVICHCCHVGLGSKNGGSVGVCGGGRMRVLFI